MGYSITEPKLNHVSNKNHVSSQKPALDDFENVKHTYTVSNQATAVEGTKGNRGEGYSVALGAHNKNYLDHVYAVSDDDGDILEHYRYSAFGEVQIYNANGNQVATTQIDNHILWNTRRRDELTGYYMYKFRHYSAELGRWLARDPIEERGGVNLYGFVGNQSLRYWDILGLVEFTECETHKLRAPLRTSCDHSIFPNRIKRVRITA